MKPTTQTYESNQDQATPREPHPWLQKHYQEKRERTVRLVKTTVDQLVKEKQTVTIEAICRKSLELDPAGRGIKKSAILENPEAHAYYRTHSMSYQLAKRRNRKVTRRRESAAPTAQLLRIDPQRDVDRARYRYLHMPKAELVERLLTVEQAYAEEHDRLAHLQFQLLDQEHQRAEQQHQAAVTAS